MEKGEWKSPRKVEEEIRQYQHQRFEDYMCLVDEGVLTRALAITALRDELDSNLIWTPQGAVNGNRPADAGTS